MRSQAPEPVVTQKKSTQKSPARSGAVAMDATTPDDDHRVDLQRSSAPRIVDAGSDEAAQRLWEQAARRHDEEFDPPSQMVDARRATGRGIEDDRLVRTGVDPIAQAQHVARGLRAEGVGDLGHHLPVPFGQCCGGLLRVDGTVGVLAAAEIEGRQGRSRDRPAIVPGRGCRPAARWWR
ncbi:hypothetical protein GDN83_03280 [Gordonia jinghuaiqii]|uniref:Uncharacterized protein n=1 Tax=Gordonia jinghuaiqii TaxID=2758710 RepID=A0A7D7LVJ5_9ACTN|nr:hypothetical protein [Gordonia jinghuaiqii]MCR5976784.1 hypothetical protein [Gordonia jinghuaiqii]QMS99955.1 hypothetical protein H1R19_13330 [Gordonia jinghuaiqii]